MKHLVRLLCLIPTLAWGQVYNLFQPATGILKGQTTTYVTTAAASSDVTSLWTGSCDATHFLRGDGSCQTVTSGTVTSVALAAPNWLTVSGSPVTSSGTLTLTGVPAADANSLGLGINALTQGGITGTNNTAVGQGGVLGAITSGSNNTAIGNQAGKALTTSSQNTAVGSGALSTLITNAGNTAFGYHALTVATGAGNTAIGATAGANVTGGVNNILLTTSGGDNITSGSSNIIIGNNIFSTTATANTQLDIGDAIVSTNYSTGPIQLQGGEVSKGTTFTISSGCATVSARTGGPTAGSFATTTTGTCTPVIALPTAPNGWVCHADDLTHPVIFTQTATSASSCTVSGATTSGDTVVFMAIGY
jgi:hypothetical protein